MARTDLPTPPTIVLVGLRGSGKSTIARLLAKRLGLISVDLDDRTPGFAGQPTVAAVFANLGEPAFRQAEARALRQALAEPGIVLALGGGTPTAPGAADLLRDAQSRNEADIVYLRAAPEVLAARLLAADNAHRPALTALDHAAEIAAIFAARDPLYSSLARVIIEVGPLAPDLAADRVMAALGRSQG